MRNLPTTDNAKTFMARNPTFIGRVGATDFYEHPILGDESPLIEITKDGDVRRSEHWELPSAQDFGS